MLIRQNEETVRVRVHMHPPGEIDAEMNLGLIAYENVHDPVFHEWLKLDPVRKREAWCDRYVFYSCACCLGKYLEERLKHDFDGANAFVADVLSDVAFWADGQTSFTEEWFKGIDRLVEDFTKLNFIAEAQSLVAIGLRTGVKKFRGLALSLSVHAAYLDALTGRREKATKVAHKLVQCPYLLPSRRELPSLCHRLMYILAAGNRIWEYRLVLWIGVSLMQASHAARDAFSAQIAKTYRGTLRALITNDVPLKYRIPFLLSSLARLLSSSRLLGWTGMDKPIRWVHLAFLFLFLDRFFIRKNELFRVANRVATGTDQMPPAKRPTWRISQLWGVRRPPRILVTRAMGGIGDILMMTPGLRALAAKYPGAQIDFAIPKSFHSVVDGLPGVRLLDIDEDVINLNAYKRWINLTDCPAGRVESRQTPNVRRNRIEIFARAMGVSKRRLKATIGSLPYYQIKSEEHEWAISRLAELNPEGKPVIGIQPYAADSYRNWPYMEQLAKELARDHLVLVFHHEPMQGFEYPSVAKIVEPLRKSIALASVCSKLVVLDSSFLHFSAALRVPTIAIFGAISGRLRTKDYPNVQLVAPKKNEYPCYPCWRHEHKPCHLTNGRESLCLRSISIDDVLSKLNKTEEKCTKMNFIGQRIIDWVRYGRE